LGTGRQIGWQEDWQIWGQADLETGRLADLGTGRFRNNNNVFASA